MQITLADAKTLESISQLEAYLSLARLPAFSAIITAYEQALENAPGFLPEENLSNYIQTKIRQELIDKFKSQEIKQNSREVFEASFQFLLLLANYWPLNAVEVAGNAHVEKKYICPITLIAIEENDKAITISGYLFTKTALQQYWVVTPEFRHPVFNEKISEREKEHIFDVYHQQMHSPVLPLPTPTQIQPFLSFRSVMQTGNYFLGVGIGIVSLGLGLAAIIGAGMLMSVGAPFLLAIGIGLASWAVSTLLVAKAVKESIRKVVNTINYVHGIFNHHGENVQPAPAPVLNANQLVLQTSAQVTTAINSINAARVPLLEMEQPVVINIASEVELDLQNDQDILQPGIREIQINEIVPLPVISLPQPAPVNNRQFCVREHRARWLNYFFPPHRQEQQIEREQEEQIEGYVYQRMVN